MLDLKMKFLIKLLWRFHSTVALAEIWKNTYKTKLIDWTPSSMENGGPHYVRAGEGEEQNQTDIDDWVSPLVKSIYGTKLSLENST